MTTTKMYSKDTKEWNESDIDELLLKLTEAEIEELNSDFDPDNSFLPPGERQKPQTLKEPTGKFDREKLLGFLEKTALEEEDWEQNKAFVKEVKGKVFVPKQQPKAKLTDNAALETEYDDILSAATEEELVDLAAILGFTGMLNQVQYHNAIENKDSIIGGCGGFQGVAKYSSLKIIPDEAPNSTDVEDVINKLKADDSGLTEVNLNNLKNISDERFNDMFEALKTNTTLTVFSMASTQLTDRRIKNLPEALRENSSLQTLNIESNFITGDTLVAIMEAVNVNKSLIELRATNQRQKVLGVKVESQMSKLVLENDKILTVAIDLSTMNARVQFNEHLQSNRDKQVRQKRLGLVNGESDA